MSHHGWTPLNVTSPHFVEKILSMNSRRSQTDVRKNPSLMRERSCSFRSLGLQCTVQYRTVMQRYDAHLSQNTLRVLSLTRCDRVGQLFSSNEFLRTLSVQEVIIPTYELASVGENQCCHFCDLSCADFPRTNSI